MGLCFNFRCSRPSLDEDEVCQFCGADLVIAQRYRAIRPLQSLRDSYVLQIFEVSDRLTGASRVLKLLNSDSPALINSLRAEALALISLHQPTRIEGAPTVEPGGFFETQLAADLPVIRCLVLEFIEGQTLEQWVNQYGRVPQSLMLSWLRQLVVMVGKLHQRNLLHCDIKPANVVIRDTGTVALIDFGSVCRVDAQYLALLGQDRAVAGETQFLLRPGTPGYAAPEQADGAIAASDFFSIGRTMVYLLTATPPLELPRRSQPLQLRWKDRARVDPPVYRLIERLMAPNPIERPSEAGQVLQYLDKLPQLLKWRQLLRSPWIQLLLAGLIGLLSLLLVHLTRLTVSQWLLMQGNSLQLAGEIELAERKYRQSLGLYDSAAVRVSLGVLCSTQSNTQCALDNLHRAIQIDPGYLEGYFNLGTVYEQLENYPDAEQTYRQIMNLNGQMGYRAANNLARLLLLQNRTLEAQQLLQKIPLNPTDPKLQAAVKKNLAWAALLNQQAEQAYELIQEALTADPTRTDSYCLSAKIKEYLKLDSYTDWVTCLMMPVENQPEIAEWKRDVLQRIQINRP